MYFLSWGRRTEALRNERYGLKVSNKILRYHLG